MSNAQEAMQRNFLARQAVTQNAIKMTQQIYSNTFDPTATPTLNIGSGYIRNAGLLLGFIVEISGNVTNSATAQANRTPMGNANMIKEFRFEDLSNYTRIQCPGWYIALLNSLRQGFGYAGSYANNIPMGYGDNYDVYDGAASIAVSTAQDLKMQYYVPVSYSSTDLRGAIYLGTVSATSNLQITVSQNPFSIAGNPIDYVYNDSDGAWTGNVTVTVYQVYLDQIPMMNGQPILPIQDLNTIYDLKQTTFTGVTAAQDFPMAYSNYRSFLSTIAVYDNGGNYNPGTDVNYFALRSANTTNIFKKTPSVAALQARQAIMTDMPDGTYLFESRDIPINTINYGNMELNLNASSANAGARVLVGFEAFSLSSQINQASSLAAG